MNVSVSQQLQTTQRVDEEKDYGGIPFIPHKTENNMFLSEGRCIISNIFQEGVLRHVFCVYHTFSLLI
jgi:hypothetical protein